MKPYQITLSFLTFILSVNMSSSLACHKCYDEIETQQFKLREFQDYVLENPPVIETDEDLNHIIFSSGVAEGLSRAKRVVSENHKSEKHN